MTIEEFDNFYSSIKNSKVLNINSRYACLITDDDIDSIDWIVNDAAKASRSKQLNVYVYDIATDTKTKAQCILTNNSDLVEENEANAFANMQEKAEYAKDLLTIEEINQCRQYSA